MDNQARRPNECSCCLQTHQFESVLNVHVLRYANAVPLEKETIEYHATFSVGGVLQELLKLLSLQSGLTHELDNGFFLQERYNFGFFSSFLQPLHQLTLDGITKNLTTNNPHKTMTAGLSH